MAGRVRVPSVRVVRGRALLQQSPPAHGDLFLVLWKFIIINFTLAEIERKPFDCNSIWESVIIRYLSKANTLSFRIGMKQMRAEARGLKLDMRHEKSLLHPLGTIRPGRR